MFEDFEGLGQEEEDEEASNWIHDLEPGAHVDFNMTVDEFLKIEDSEHFKLSVCDCCDEPVIVKITKTKSLPFSLVRVSARVIETPRVEPEA